MVTQKRRLRPYQPSDLLPLLAFLGDCIRQNELQGYHTGDLLHLMSNSHKGQDLDKYLWLHEEGNQILAFAELTPALWAGYGLVVHPDHRGGSLEKALLRECQDSMQQRMRVEQPEKTLLLIMAVASDQVRISCLAELGYQSEESDYMFSSRSLGTPIPIPQLPAGFLLRQVEGVHEAGLLAEVHSLAFDSGWTAESYREVMLTPGFHPERELVVVEPGGRFAAFLIYWLDPVSKSGLFEPVGCHPQFRRRGLTTALLHEGMRRMKAEGMETALVGTRSSNEAASALYRSVGFEAYYKTVNFTIDLAPVDGSQNSGQA